MDNAPVAVSDVGSVTKGTLPWPPATCCRMTATPRAILLRVTAVNGQAASVGTTLVGTYGTLLARRQWPVHLYAGQQPGERAGAQRGPGGHRDLPLHPVRWAVPPRAAPGPWQNLLKFSEAFNNAAWSRFSVPGTLPAITADAAADPFGTTITADRVTLSGVASGIYQSAAVTGQHSFSVWMRLASGDGHFSFNYYDGSSNSLQSAVATGEWQRFTWTFTGNGAGSGNVALMHTSASRPPASSRSGARSSTPAATAQDYLPTTSAPVTIANPPPTEAVISSTLTISINGTSNSAPVAVSDVGVGDQGHGSLATGNVLSNDSDAEGVPCFASPRSMARRRMWAPPWSAPMAPCSSAPMASTPIRWPATRPTCRRSALARWSPRPFATPCPTGSPTWCSSPGPWQNLLKFSEAFNNAAWSRFSVPGTLPAITADAAADPFGTTTTADRVTLSGVASGIYQNAAVTGQHSFSVWMRLASGDGHFSFNYYNGSSNSLQSAVATGEWQRFTWTFTGNGAGSGNVALMHDFSQSATGVFEVWGAQLNAGATAQNYLPTTSAPVTIANPRPPKPSSPPPSPSPSMVPPIQAC
jgi:hypothetical protein